MTADKQRGILFLIQRIQTAPPFFLETEYFLLQFLHLIKHFSVKAPPTKASTRLDWNELCRKSDRLFYRNRGFNDLWFAKLWLQQISYDELKCLDAWASFDYIDILKSNLKQEAVEKVNSLVENVRFHCVPFES